MIDTDLLPWPRRRWEELADQLLLAVRPYASERGALIRLPGPTSASGPWSDGLEGFARTFLLAAFRITGSGGDDPHGLLSHYAEGLRQGTDPGSPERWPRMTERRQARVEAASIAIALSETRRWLWDLLDGKTQAHIVDWLSDIVGTADHTNNWLWFQNVVEAFLSSVGGPWSQEDLDRNAELQERLYVGDGWYSDGTGRDGRLQNFDHYAGWAWHVYPVLEARIRGAELSQTHRTRLASFLEQAVMLVGGDGAPLLQGRSLTYRFAMLAPFWAGNLAEATPLTPGQTRTVTSAVMQHFDDHAAVDDAGLLPVGWHHEFRRIRQLYTGGGSPYWASKAFLGLLLHPGDPVWTAEPEGPPGWDRDVITSFPAPGWLLQRTSADGVVRVVNHGTDRLIEPFAAPVPDDPFYRRVAYSTHSAPQLLPETIAAPVESHVALLDSDGLPSHRGGVERIHLSGNVAVSRCRPYWLDHGGLGRSSDSASWASLRIGPTLTIASVVRGHQELRLAWVDSEHPSPSTQISADIPASEESPWPRDSGPWRIRFGGWAVAGRPCELDIDVSRAEAAARVRRRGDGLVSAVRGMRGLHVADAINFQGADPIGPSSAVPWVGSSGPVKPGDVVAALVSLSGAESSSGLPEITVPADDPARILVRWPDETCDEIPAGPQPAAAPAVVDQSDS